MYKVFIDGSAGTTGLRINERLSSFDGIEILTLPDDKRKDPAYRKEKLNQADVVFLCLPDDAAREAVSMISNPSVKVIDTSTAHRVNDAWAYGFPEIGGNREKIKSSNLIANPGCHASGFISLIAPLTENNIISKNALLSCFSLTGYTGGGKKMIAEYESAVLPDGYLAPRQYALTQTHKHLPEMVKQCKLDFAPVFSPIVSSFPCGMEVSIPLHKSMINGSLTDIKEIYQNYYKGEIVKFVDESESGFLTAEKYKGLDSMGVSAFGNDDRIILVSRFDNLGKGASGAAIQNMNVILGFSESKGLKL